VTSTAAGDEFSDSSYEELIETMEALTTRMAGGDIGIEEVADLYERVGRLHAEATSRLARVRDRIESLMAAGNEPSPPASPAEQR
jgi:exodeoxyribonuclease VII small subunit